MLRGRATGRAGGDGDVCGDLLSSGNRRSPQTRVAAGRRSGEGSCRVLRAVATVRGGVRVGGGADDGRARRRAEGNRWRWRARRRRRQSETTGRRLHGVSWRGRASRERTKRVSAGSVTRELLMAGDNRAVAATHLALAITTGRSATSTSFDENAPSRRSARLRSVDVPRSGRTFCDTPSPDDSAPSATRGDRNPRCARRRPTRSWQLRDALRSAAALRLANVGETPRHGPRVPGAAAPFAHPFSATQSSRCCSSTPLPERALGPAERAMRRDDL